MLIVVKVPVFCFVGGFHAISSVGNKLELGIIFSPLTAN
jgi:hypothetical protein